MDLFGKMAVFLGGAAGILAPPEQLGAHLLSGPIRARPAKKESAAIASGAPCRGAGQYQSISTTRSASVASPPASRSSA